MIALIRAAKDPAEAKQGLMSNFSLSDRQSQAILDMRFTAPHQPGARQDHRGVRSYPQADRALPRDFLADEREVAKIIVEELGEVRELFADARRTEIIDRESDISDEDLIAEEDMVVTVSHEGYIKRNALSEYRAQRRGGRGKIGASTKDADFIEDVFVASTHAFILFFTTKGRLFWKKVYQLPNVGPRPLAARRSSNLLSLAPDEKVSAFLAIREFRGREETSFLRPGSERSRRRRSKSTRTRARRGSSPSRSKKETRSSASARRDGDEEIILSTRNGKAIRFREKEARPMGRAAAGVRGILLDADDEVVAVDVVDLDSTLLTVAEKGYGKRTEMAEYRITGRGGKGILTLRVTDRVGRVAGVRMVGADDHIMLITDAGKVIRTPVKHISVIGRNTQGVRLIDLVGDEKVVGVARLGEEDDSQGDSAQSP